MIDESERTVGGADLPRQSIKVLIAEDSPSFLEALKRFLEQQQAFQVIGVAHNGIEAVEQALIFQPDLVLMDIKMPNMNGLEATLRIKTRPDAPKIILITVCDTAGYRKAAEDAEADGFVGKSRLRTDLLPAIEKLFAK